MATLVFFFVIINLRPVFRVDLENRLAILLVVGFCDRSKGNSKLSDNYGKFLMLATLLIEISIIRDYSVESLRRFILNKILIN